MKKLFLIRLKRAFYILFHNYEYSLYWDKPNGCCSLCGAPLNEYLVGGYKIHDGKYSVKAYKEIERIINEYK